ncbi:MAG TPA: hypothetical protein VK961_17845 [Chthoniobacter sp.]|nr:hypothetical protein [Chthoniobacter sp.]
MNKKLRIQRKSTSGKPTKRATRQHAHPQETLGHQLLTQSNPSPSALDAAGQHLPLNQLP